MDSIYHKNRAQYQEKLQKWAHKLIDRYRWRSSPNFYIHDLEPRLVNKEKQWLAFIIPAFKDFVAWLDLKAYHAKLFISLGCSAKKLPILSIDMQALEQLQKRNNQISIAIFPQTPKFASLSGAVQLPILTKSIGLEVFGYQHFFPDESIKHRHDTNLEVRSPGSI